MAQVSWSALSSAPWIRGLETRLRSSNVAVTSFGIPAATGVSARHEQASDAVLVGISELHLCPHSKLSHTPGQCFCMSVNAYERETSGSLSRVAWRLIHLSYMHALHLPCVKKMEESQEHRIGDTTIPGRALEPKPEIWSPQGSRGGHSSESCCE